MVQILWDSMMTVLVMGTSMVSHSFVEGLEIAKPGCMEGVSTAFQSDQAFLIFSTRSTYLFSFRLCVSSYLVSKQMVGSTRHTMWLCGCWCSRVLGQGGDWAMWGERRCMIGGCVNLLSDNLQQRRVACRYFLSPPVLHHVWYCSLRCSGTGHWV